MVWGLGFGVWGLGFGVWGLGFSGMGVTGAEGAAVFPGRVEEREFFIDHLLVRIYVIIEMIWWTGLAPWELEFPFPGCLISTFLVRSR